MSRNTVYHSVYRDNTVQNLFGRANPYTNQARRINDIFSADVHLIPLQVGSIKRVSDTPQSIPGLLLKSSNVSDIDSQTRKHV